MVKAIARKVHGIRLALFLALLGVPALAQTSSADPAGKISNVLCSIYNNYLGNSTIIFAALLVIVAWAGYQIYMGKREASDTILRAVIATAVILGASAIAGLFVSGVTC